VLVVVGHLEEALVEAVILEDLSMATSLSSDFGFLEHSWTLLREWLVHPAFSSLVLVILQIILTPAHTPTRV
jgi:hypothetical protein